MLPDLKSNMFGVAVNANTTSGTIISSGFKWNSCMYRKHTGEYSGADNKTLSEKYSGADNKPWSDVFSWEVWSEGVFRAR